MPSTANRTGRRLVPRPPSPPLLQRTRVCVCVVRSEPRRQESELRARCAVLLALALAPEDRPGCHQLTGERICCAVHTCAPRRFKTFVTEMLKRLRFVPCGRAARARVRARARARMMRVRVHVPACAGARGRGRGPLGLRARGRGFDPACRPGTRGVYFLPPLERGRRCCVGWRTAQSSDCRSRRA